ncbi:MAG: ACT domain-containing protein [Anaerolineaceae bacterium]|nr:ACT domain-containing protein [Anaerolineaceae bacterium]
MGQLKLSVLSPRFAVCRLETGAEVPASLYKMSFFSITRTDEELSIVLPEADAPQEWVQESGWRCFKVQGPLDFGLTGILAAIAAPLADARISIFAFSTYDTDYVMVKETHLEQAKHALTENGFEVI